MTELRTIVSADITDAGSLGRTVLQARTMDDLRKLFIVPRKRSRTLEQIGFWLVGCLLSLVVAGVIAVAYWSQTRTIQETMEGGWTRKVIDYNVSYAAIFLPIAVVCLAVWTIGYVAFRLVEDS